MVSLGPGHAPATSPGHTGPPKEKNKGTKSDLCDPRLLYLTCNTAPVPSVLSTKQPPVLRMGIGGECQACTVGSDTSKGKPLMQSWVPIFRAIEKQASPFGLILLNNGVLKWLCFVCIVSASCSDCLITQLLDNLKRELRVHASEGSRIQWGCVHAPGRTLETATPTAQLSGSGLCTAVI